MLHNKKIRKATILLFWIAVWYLLDLLVDNSILLVSPWEMLRRLGEFVVESAFWRTIGLSLLRIGMGFLLGFMVALVLAGISFRYPLAEETLRPVITLVKTVPVAAFAVLLLIWWGSSVLAVAICFLVVLPNIYLNTLEGLKAADWRLLEMSKVFHLSGKNRFWYIYRPALKPFLMSGMKLSLGMCWKSGVAAEVIGTPVYSIGGALYLAKIHLDTAGMLAWTMVIIVFSFLFERLVLRLAQGFFAWMPTTGRGEKAGQCFPKRLHDDKKIAFAELQHVTKYYGEQLVLTDVSAVYEAGNIYYLTSPSGSGKTTLLRLLCGLEKPDRGRVMCSDRCSMVFQEDRLCEEYTAVENVAMVLGDSKGAISALENLLEKEAFSKPCKQLSGGMKRRVALVRAMEADSDVVLLDEPFTGMDEETKRKAEEYIKKRQNGRVVVIATHI